MKVERSGLPAATEEDGHEALALPARAARVRRKAQGQGLTLCKSRRHRGADVGTFTLLDAWTNTVVADCLQRDCGMSIDDIEAHLANAS